MTLSAALAIAITGIGMAVAQRLFTGEKPREEPPEERPASDAERIPEIGQEPRKLLGDGRTRREP